MWCELRAQSGPPQRVRTHADGAPCPGLVVGLVARQNAWTLRVHAELAGPGDVYLLGVVHVPPAVRASDQARVVAIAHCPGAVAWTVEAACASVAAAGERSGLELAALLVGSGAPGLHHVPPAELEGARRSYQGGVLEPGDTSVTIGRGSRVLVVSAWQVGEGGTVTIGSDNAVPLPPDGAVTIEPARYVSAAAGLEIAFESIETAGGYLIEIEA